MADWKRRRPKKGVEYRNKRIKEGSGGREEDSAPLRTSTRRASVTQVPVFDRVWIGRHATFEPLVGSVSSLSRSKLTSETPIYCHVHR